MTTEQHLLFAVLAFESELIDLPQLTAACRAWAKDKSKPLAELLVARGWLTTRDREFVESLVKRKLAKHQNDPRVTLNSVVRGDVCDAIKEVEDADIQKSLSSWPSAGPVLIETIGETQIEPGQPKSRYTWISEVGKGGLGKVWLARDNDLAREVALKEVKPGSASTEAVRRLIKEAQITGQLQHPNIVPVYEVNRGGRPFYTMKLVKGETLSKAIRRHHEQNSNSTANGGRQPTGQPAERPTIRLTPDVRRDTSPSMFDLLSVFVNVCEALAYAHSRGIIHRDLKPENIVLGDYGEAIVLDWGLAKQIGSADEETAPVVLTEDAQSPATRLGATPGTPAYMSPEQAAGRVDLLDHRTDIYGLGTILFEILTGQPPHRAPNNNQASGAASAPRSDVDCAPGVDCASGVEPANHRGADAAPLAKIATIHDLMRRISESPTPRARDLDATISRELDAICATAMSKKRDERYLDAKALAADVKRSLAHQPVSVYRTTPWERLRLWRRRNPAVAALSLFLAASLLTGSIVSTLFGLAANREAGRANTEANRANTEASNAIRERTKAVEFSLANVALAQQEKSAREIADHRAEEARASAYLANIRLAATKWGWERNDFPNMIVNLEAVRPKPDEPDIREWEWHYLWNQSHAERLTLRGHSDEVQSVAFSPDGKRIVSGSWDRTVKVWDAETGQEMLTLKGHFGWVYSVSFSPNGKRIVSGGSGDEKGEIKVWDAENGQETLTLKGHSAAVECASFSPSGKQIVSGSWDKTAKVWDAENGREMLTLKGHSDGVSQVWFHPNGMQIVTGSRNESGDMSVKIWDSESGQEKLTLKGYSHVAFSPDGMRIFSGSMDGTVKVSDAESGEEIPVPENYLYGATSLSFSPDGKRVVSKGGQGARVWETVNGEAALTLKGHSGLVFSASFSPDGKRIVTGSSKTLKIWDAEAVEETVKLKGPSMETTQASFSSEGKLIVTVSPDNSLKVWDAESGQEMHTLKGHSSEVTSVSFSSDGKRIVSGSRKSEDVFFGLLSGRSTLKVWDTESGQETLSLTGHSADVRTVSFSPDGKRIVAGSSDGTVKTWNAENGREIHTLKLHPGSADSQSFRTLHSLSFSPDGTRIASSGSNSVFDEGQLKTSVELKVSNAESGQDMVTLEGHSEVGTSVCFSPNGERIASGCRDNTVNVWDANSGKVMLTLSGHLWPVSSVSFSPDGKRIVSGSGVDDTVIIWDAKSGQELLTLKTHSGPVSRVSFSPDGKRIFAISRNGSMTIWDGRPKSETRH